MNLCQTSNEHQRLSPEPSPVAHSKAFHFDNDDQTCHLFELLGSPPRRRRHENDPEKLPVVDAERLITEGLYKLNMEEREGALHDIHGVSEGMQETEEFVEEHLNKLHNDLQLPRYTNSSSSSCEAYQLARQQSPRYVASLYKIFLRSRSYNVSEAADLMMRHFDLKRDLFGVAALGRPITLTEDFDEFDMESLRAGYFQLLPQRDRSGRAILFAALNRYTYRSLNNFFKVLWYLRMVALKDEETQKKGFVSVTWCDSVPRNVDTRMLMGMRRMRHSLPMRSAAIHHCFSNPAFGNILRWFTLSMLESKSRPRTRLHQGSLIEARYEIMSFGIPPSSIPMNSEGYLQLDNHLRFIQVQQRREQEDFFRRRHSRGGGSSFDEGTTASIIIPASMDILFGRGTIKQRSVGNMDLSDLYEEYAVAYNNARKLEKAKIAMEIVHTLKEKKGGRFLVKEEDDWTWTQVDDKTACKKICQGFRNRKQILLPTANNDSNTKSTTSTTALQPPEKRRMVSSSSTESNGSSVESISAGLALSASDLIVELNDPGNKRLRTF